MRHRSAFGPEAGLQRGSPYWPFTRDGELAEHVMRSVDGDWPWDRWYWQVVQLRVIRPVEGPVLGTSPKVVWTGYAMTRAGARRKAQRALRCCIAGGRQAVPVWR